MRGDGGSGYVGRVGFPEEKARDRVKDMVCEPREGFEKGEGKKCSKGW